MCSFCFKDLTINSWSNKNYRLKLSAYYWKHYFYLEWKQICRCRVSQRCFQCNFIFQLKTVRQESVRKKIQTLMQSCSLTSDIWTSLAHDGYINLNIHFIDKNFNKHTYLLDVSAFKGKHSHDMQTLNSNSLL